MAMSKVEARDQLMQYVISKSSPTPPTPAELVVDSFYDDFRAGKSEEDLPAVEVVIADLKGSAQKQP
jgi:hypothetical protein